MRFYRREAKVNKQRVVLLLKKREHDIRSKLRYKSVLLRSICGVIASVLTACSAGSGPTQSPSGATYVAPLGSPPADSIAFSPQGDKLLVTAGDVGRGRAQVYALDLETGEKSLLADSDYGDFVTASWSPDGNRVLVVAREGTLASGEGGLWLIDVATGRTEYLLDSGYGAWSPDGKTIATFSVEGINTASERLSLSLIDLQTRIVNRIYESTRMKYFFGLAWSPDGGKLVFSVGASAPGDLYVIDTHTRQVVQITENTHSTNPAWSPAGDVIAYTSWPAQGSTTTLHLVSPEGTCDLEIPHIEDAWSPTWSSDGSKLGFVGSDGIYVLDLISVLGSDGYRAGCA